MSELIEPPSCSSNQLMVLVGFVQKRDMLLHQLFRDLRSMRVAAKENNILTATNSVEDWKSVIELSSSDSVMADRSSTTSHSSIPLAITLLKASYFAN